MKILPRNIDAFVKKPAPETLAILIYGPDEGLVRERLNLLTKTVVPDINDPFNVCEIAADSLSENPAQLQDEAQSISMMGGRRVVRLRDAQDSAEKYIRETVEALKPGDSLVLVTAGNLGKASKLRDFFEKSDKAAAIPCYVDDTRDLRRVIADSLREQEYRIAPEALDFIAENIVGDRGAARAEVEKLVLYMGGQNKNITLDDAAAAIGNGAMLSTDNLSQNIVIGDFAAADRTLRFLLSEGVSGVALLRNLQNYYARLYITRARTEKGESLDSAMKKLRPEVFFRYKPAFEAMVANRTASQLEQALSLLVSAEARCKQSGADPDLVLGRAVLTLTQMSARARRRA